MSELNHTYIIAMIENQTPLQNVNCVLDDLRQLKEAEAFFDLFDLVIHFMSYQESKRPEVVQLDLLKDSYRSRASALIEEMENYLIEVQKVLK